MALVASFLPTHSQAIAASDRVRVVTTEGRVKERFLVLTDTHLALFDLQRLTERHYVPTMLTIKSVARLIRPVLPETTFYIVGGGEEPTTFNIIAPDRELFLEPLQRLHQKQVLDREMRAERK